MDKILLVAVCLLLTVTSSYAASSGRISYYSEGKHTASGERFNKNALTCAHRRLPFGTKVMVSYRGRSVTCRVNDRGPFIRGRVLDVSLGAAKALGMTGRGVVVASLSW
jgi:rare lipoprotein A